MENTVSTASSGGTYILDVFIYFAALLIPLIATAIFVILKKKPLYIICTDILLWLITVTVLNNIFPLNVGNFVKPFEPSLPCGFIVLPIENFPSDISMFFGQIKIIFICYYPSMMFGLIIGFGLPLISERMRKFIPAFVCIVCTLLFTEGALILTNTIVGGRNKLWETKSPLLAVVLFIIGFWLARLVLKVKPGVTELFDGRREVKKAGQTENKPVFDAAVKRKNKFEDV